VISFKDDPGAACIPACGAKLARGRDQGPGGFRFADREETYEAGDTSASSSRWAILPPGAPLADRSELRFVQFENPGPNPQVTVTGEVTFDIAIGHGPAVLELQGRACEISGQAPAREMHARHRRRVSTSVTIPGLVGAFGASVASLDRDASVASRWKAIRYEMRTLSAHHYGG
jgi:hypothetical protein